MRAYVSSTYSDLKEYRQVAFEQLYRLKIEPLGMEYFGATAIPPVEQCLRAVEEADIYILIIGHRYGFIPEGFDKSITHLEYEEALQRGIPIFAFILSDDVPVPASSIEVNETLRGKLSSLKNDIYRKFVTATIRSRDEFSASLTTALTEYILNSRKEKVESDTSSDLTRCHDEVERYKKVIEDYSSKLTNIVPANPIWRGRKFQRDELLCFALLPFKDEFFEVYESAVAPAAEELGLRALHAGEIFGNREIVEDIWDSICAARIVVVDVTGRNPNVFYELGICHTLGKDCVVITQNSADVPFDIRHLRFIEYSPAKIALLRSSLRKTIQTILSTTPKENSDEK